MSEAKDYTFKITKEPIEHTIYEAGTKKEAINRLKENWSEDFNEELSDSEIEVTSVEKSV